MPGKGRTLEQFRNGCKPQRQASSWFSLKGNHSSRSLPGHSNCETALKRNIVVRDLGAGKFLVVHRGSLIEGTGVGSRTAAATAVFRATARQQHNVVDDDLGAVLLLPGCLIIPGAGLNPAFDVQLGALLHVVTNDFRHPLVRGQVVPLGAVLPLA